MHRFHSKETGGINKKIVFLWFLVIVAPYVEYIKKKKNLVAQIFRLYNNCTSIWLLLCGHAVWVLIKIRIWGKCHSLQVMENCTAFIWAYVPWKRSLSNLNIDTFNEMECMNASWYHWIVGHIVCFRNLRRLCQWYWAVWELACGFPVLFLWKISTLTW